MLSIKERIETLEMSVESLEKDIEELREATTSDIIKWFEEIAKKVEMKEDIQLILKLYREMEGGVSDV